MRAYPANGWTITHINVADARTPCSGRPARVLLQRDRTSGHLLPLRGDAEQLFGALVAEASLEEWKPLEPTAAWAPGKVPIWAEPGRLEFVVPTVLERRRYREADNFVVQALAAESVPEAEGLIELADCPC